jgi:suppressor for copper-sensitivity B
VASATAALFAVSAYLPLASSSPPAPSTAGRWAELEPSRIAGLVAEGQVVFVNVTAEWCMTCKVNETAVLARPLVRERLGRPGVVAMRGDWTRPDAEISRYLAGFGRYGIPFDAVYGPGLPDGLALPELLTVEAVMAALDRAGGPARQQQAAADR